MNIIEKMSIMDIEEKKFNCIVTLLTTLHAENKFILRILLTSNKISDDKIEKCLKDYDDLWLEGFKQLEVKENDYDE